jgi:putative ABC transport system permease protein
MIRDGIRRVFDLALRRRDRWEREVEDEIKLHLLLRAEQLGQSGVSADDAYAEAVRRFGPLSQSRAALFDAARHRETRMQRTEFLADARQDVAFALRTLSRQKAWTAITVATLALGIGATTAVFSVVSTLLLHPLPYPRANRVVYVQEQPASGNNTGISVSITPSAKEIRQWRQNAHSFEAMEPTRTRPLSLKTTTGDPSSVYTTAILPTFPDFAGARPIAGRMFTDSDIIAGGRVALLGETFWRERLGGSRSVLGQLITVGDSAYAVIGVMPASLRIGGPGTRPTDVWLPFDLRDDKAAGNILARLRPGVSPAVAARELDSIDARVVGATAGKLPFLVTVSTPAERVRFRSSLYLLSAAVALVLLVACVNVAHLLLARSATRQREMALRAALGAGRGRLLRQLLTESLLLSAAGTLAGIGVGLVGVRALIAFRPTSHDELKAAHLDATTLAIAIGVALVSGVVFGIIGAVQSSRSSTHDALKAGAANASAGARHRRLRSVLVVSEIALSAMLVVGSALVVRSLASLQHTDLGFDPRGLYGMDVTFQSRALPPVARAQILNEFATRVRALPGVRALTLARAEPGSRWFAVGRLQIEGEPPPPKTAMSFIDLGYVRPNYFSTMGIALREGTNFTDTTVAGMQVIINEGFARKHWARGTAVGHRVRIADTDSEPWFTIVGVAHDALTDGPMAESDAPFFYVPVDSGRRAEAILVRVNGDGSVLAPAIAIGKQMGIRDVSINGVERFIDKTLSEPRFVTMVMSVFGVIGLVLAAIGLYGVMSYTITQQTREIGIRVALGAPRSHVVNRVLRRGAALAATGTAFGLLAAGWGTKLIASQLHGVERLDPISFAAGAVVLIGAALLACIVPARRAVAVDPITAIRAE